MNKNDFVRIFEASNGKEPLNTVHKVIDFFQPLFKKKSITLEDLNFSFVSLNIEDGINATDEYDVKSFLADVIYCYVFEASYDDDAVAFLNDIVAEEGYSKGWESIKDFRDYLLSESIWDGHWSDPGFSDEEYSELFDKYKDKILKNLTGL